MTGVADPAAEVPGAKAPATEGRSAATRARALLALLPQPASRLDSFFFALGVATVAVVGLATLEQLILRLTPLRLPPLAAEPLIAGIAIALLYAMHGTRAALPAAGAAAVAAASILGTYGDLALTFAVLGRTPVLRDPAAQIGAGIFAIALFVVAGAVAGLLVQRWLPDPRPVEAHVLVRAIGVALVVGAAVRLVWPNQFVAAALFPEQRFDARVALVQLPHVLAGPIAGGVYAAFRRARYIGVTVVGLALSAPAMLLQLGFTLAAADQRVAPLIPDLRAQAALGWFLIALRIASWPMSMAFVHAFLTRPEGSSTLPANT